MLGLKHENIYKLKWKENQFHGDFKGKLGCWCSIRSEGDETGKYLNLTSHLGSGSYRSDKINAKEPCKM